jgi:DNA-binding SARP family transcriptional activator
MEQLWSFQVLGVFRAASHFGSTTTEIPFTTYAKKLTSFLIANSRSALTKQEVAERIWPFAASAQARNRLHVAIHDFRAATSKVISDGVDLLEVTRLTVSFNPVVKVESDWYWLLQASNQLNTMHECELSAAAYLAEFRCFPGESGVAWIDRMNDFAGTLGNQVQFERIQRLLDSARYEQALSIAEPACLEAPTNEELCKQLMECFFKLGKREAALQAYDRVRRNISDAYDMRVSEPLKNYAAMIRANNAADGEHRTRIDRLDGEFTRRDLTSPPPNLTHSLNREAYTAEAHQLNRKAVASLKMLLQRSSSPVVWLWGAPGCGKTSAANQALAELGLTGRDQVIELSLLDISNLESLIERVLNLSQTFLPEPDFKTILLIDTKSLEDFDWASAIGEISLRVRNLKILVVSDLPAPQNVSSSVQVTNLQTLAPAAFDTGLSEAHEHFWHCAHLYELQAVVERIPAAQIDDICRFLGGNPAMIEQAVNQLQQMPFSLLKEYLIALAVKEHPPNSPSLAARLRRSINRGLVQSLSHEERSVIELLRTVGAQISLASAANLCDLPPLQLLEAIKTLSNRGVVECIRSTDFDLIFVALSGFNATILGSLGFKSFNAEGCSRIVNRYSHFEIPSKQQDLQLHRQFKEILRFELPWIEFAIEYTFAANLRQSTIKLSKLLRRSYFDSGNLESAARFFTYALDATDNDKEIADFYSVLGGLLERSGMTQLASKRLLSGLSYAKRCSDDLRIATMRHSLGNVCNSKGQTQRGESLLRSALNTYEKLGIYERCQLVAASLSLSYMIDLQHEKARQILEQFRPLNPSDRHAGVQSWHLCSAYLAYFQGRESAFNEHLELTKLIGAGVDHAQLAFKTVLLRLITMSSKQEFKQAIELAVKGARLMVASDFRADAVHCMALEALARIALKDTYNAHLAIARAVAVLPGVEDLEATGVLIFACVMLHHNSEFRFEEPGLRSTLHQKLEKLPAYILAAFSAEPNMLEPFLMNERIAKVSKQFAGVKASPFFNAIEMSCFSSIASIKAAPQLVGALIKGAS